MATIAEDQVLVETLLRLGDDSLILGQRLGEWCGHAPSVEVDLSLANMGLDLIGQATHFLGRAGEVEGQGRDGDALAFHRDVLDFRNCLLVEQPNGDFAQTMARQFLFSTWQEMLFGHLEGSSDETIAAIAAKAVKEVRYHAELAAEWVIRLGDGTDESRRADGGRARLDVALRPRAVRDGRRRDRGAPSAASAPTSPPSATITTPASAPCSPKRRSKRPPDQRPILGGRRGHHSEHLGHLLAVMQFLPRTYPDATW